MEIKTIENNWVALPGVTYTTDSFKVVKDEDGTEKTVRVELVRQAGQPITTVNKTVRFHRGARIS